MASCFSVFKHSNAPLFFDSAFAFSNTVFQRVFTDYADSVIDGGTYIGNEGVISAMISGKIVVGLAPSYHYSNFGNKIYFFDNSTMPLELDVLCSPYFSSGQPVSLLRSAGLAILESTEQKIKLLLNFAVCYRVCNPICTVSVLFPPKLRKCMIIFFQNQIYHQKTWCAVC